MKIQALAAGASLIALAWSAAATAQVTGAPSPNPPSAGSSVAEVVVTAERRTTKLQDTPIAATVLSGSDLARNGVFTVDQLQFISPSLTVNNFGQGNDFDIRGIGKGEHNSQTGTGVVTYRDGVATFPGYFQEEPYYDIADVEVLRGPQGAFSGQNATGGAVIVNSQSPVIGGGYHGYLLGSFGNYDAVNVQGAINLPITDTFAARVAFNTNYMHPVQNLYGPFTGDPNLRWASMRLGFLWEPTSQWKISLKTDYNYLNNGGYFGPPLADYNPDDLFHVGEVGRAYALDQFVRTVLQIDYTASNGIDFRSITGYQHGRTSWDGGIGGTSTLDETIDEGVDETLWSQEFNIISPDKGPITWVLGAYYDKNVYDFPNGQFDIGVPPGGLDLNLQGINRTYSAAGFGQISFKLPDLFELQLGARYTHWYTRNDVLYYIPEYFAYGYAFYQHAVETGDNVTGKATLNWHMNDDNFFYGFVATGAKPGGLNVSLYAFTPIPGPFRQEYVTDYEIGWKSTLLDGHLKTQLGGFYSDFAHFQVIVPIPDNPTASTEYNDPNPTKIYGLEATAQGVFDDFSFNIGLGLQHSSVGRFYAADPRLPAGPIGACSITSGPAAAPPAGNCFDLAGHTQTYAPNFTFDVGAQYIIHLADGDTLTPRASYSHISSQWGTLFDNYAAGDYLAARNIVNAQLAFNHQTWTLTGYVSNLTDDKYVSALVSPIKIPGLPRQFGVSLLKTF